MLFHLRRPGYLRFGWHYRRYGVSVSLEDHALGLRFEYLIVSRPYRKVKLKECGW